MSLFVVGMNYGKAGPDAIKQARSVDAEELLDAVPYPGKAVLSTCHRLELVFHSSDECTAERAGRFLERFLHGRVRLERRSGYCSADRECLIHLCRLASGLESPLIGECEIMGQMREARMKASERGTLSRPLDRALRFALATGRKVRRLAALTRGPVSYASAVFDIVGRYAGWSGTSVLVVGAGRMADTIIARIVKKTDSRVIVANRTYETAASISAARGIGVIGFDEIPEALATVDAVICATNAPGRVLAETNAGKALASRAKPLLVVDLGVPRNVDPRLGDGTRARPVRIVDLAGVAGLVNRTLRERKRKVADAERLIEKEVSGFEARNRYEEKQACKSPG